MEWLYRDFRKLVAVGFGCAVVLAASVSATAAAVFTRNLVEQDARAVSELLCGSLTHVLPVAFFESGRQPGAARRYASAIREIVGPDIFASLYDRHGVVLWSDDKSLVGRNFVHNQEVRSALEGELQAEIVPSGGEPLGAGKLPPARMVEIYVPLRYAPDGDVVGVLSVRRNAPGLFAAIDRAWTSAWAAGGAGTLLLSGGLYGFVYAAPRYRARRDANGRKESPPAGRVAWSREAVVESGREIAFMLDVIGKITALGPGFAAITGWWRSDWIGKPLADLIHPDDVPVAGEIYRGTALGRFSTFSARVLIRTGEYIECEFVIIPQMEQGRVSAVAGAAHEVRPRVAAARRLQRDRNERRIEVKTETSAIVCLEGQGRIVYFSAAAEEVFRYPAAEIIYEPLTALVSERSRELVREHVTSILAPEATAVADATVEAAGRRKDGSEFPLEASLVSWRTDAGAFVIAVLRDATERAVTRAALLRLNDVLEDELRRIGQELHNEAAQLLAAVHLAVRKWAQEVQDSSSMQFRRIIDLLDQIEVRLRDLSHELYPKILDDLGLVPALEFFGGQISERTGLAVIVEGSTGGRLPSVIETTAYRVAQEALTNVVRHARAGCARIRIERDARALRCTFTDDGVGFDVSEILSRKGDSGLGLIGIRERVASLGGAVQIEALPGRGTALILRIPLEA